MKTTTRKASKTIKTRKEPKIIGLFQGKVPAVRVLYRSMKEFKNCKATCWLLIGPNNYVFANSYNSDTPKASFDPSKYCYELTPKAQKLLDKKIEEQEFVEIEDPAEWPQWATSAAAKRKRKAK